MKVFGIGLPRTGTTSLTVALSRLGFDTWHYPPTLETGLRAAAACDGLIVAHWRQLLQDYPDAKYILTVRDVPSWLDSYRSLYELHYATIAAHGAGGWVGPVNRIAEQIYGQWRLDPAVWAAKYHSHEAEVRAAFADKPDQLLILDLRAGDGWPQLCSFLDLECPPGPFPKRNTRAVLGHDKFLGTGYRLFYPEMTGAEGLAAKVAPAFAAGIDGINFYNLGLVPAARLDWVAHALRGAG